MANISSAYTFIHWNPDNDFSEKETHILQSFIKLLSPLVEDYYGINTDMLLNNEEDTPISGEGRWSFYSSLESFSIPKLINQDISFEEENDDENTYHDFTIDKLFISTETYALNEILSEFYKETNNYPLSIYICDFFKKFVSPIIQKKEGVLFKLIYNDYESGMGFLDINGEGTLYIEDKRFMFSVYDGDVIDNPTRDDLINYDFIPEDESAEELSEKILDMISISEETKKNYSKLLTNELETTAYINSEYIPADKNSDMSDIDQVISESFGYYIDELIENLNNKVSEKDTKSLNDLADEEIDTLSTLEELLKKAERITSKYASQS